MVKFGDGGGVQTGNAIRTIFEKGCHFEHGEKRSHFAYAMSNLKKTDFYSVFALQRL
ncbi:hypothetical protein BGP_2722 [Beggiatoa sp. PS]|nr:hypothetical protein BGP_2722 [Beggiatoa sp. PS]